MEDLDLVSTGVLMLVAGHETTVNLISNGTLTDAAPARTSASAFAPNPRSRSASSRSSCDSSRRSSTSRPGGRRADIDIGGVTIPKGSRIVLLLAAASRDPDLFANPDQFDPDRPNIEHYGFGGGIHYCFGAPLARLEGQLALTAIARALENPKLLVDPPPYRPSPVLRGPIHLEVDVDAVVA